MRNSNNHINNVETIEPDAAEARLQGQGDTIAIGIAQRQAAMQPYEHTDEQGGKQVPQQQRSVTGPAIVTQASKQQEQAQEQSQIHHDWSKIEKAISSLSDETLDDCVKRLNESVFRKLYESSNVDRSKHDISMKTLDRIMSEIDVKTHYIDKQNKNKNNEKEQYVGKERRQFISKPVMLYSLFCIYCF